jgi:hypothetical protein
MLEGLVQFSTKLTVRLLKFGHLLRLSVRLTFVIAAVVLPARSMVDVPDTLPNVRSVLVTRCLPNH